MKYVFLLVFLLLVVVVMGMMGMMQDSRSTDDSPPLDVPEKQGGMILKSRRTGCSPNGNWCLNCWEERVGNQRKWIWKCRNRQGQDIVNEMSPFDCKTRSVSNCDGKLTCGLC